MIAGECWYAARLDPEAGLRAALVWQLDALPGEPFNLLSAFSTHLSSSNGSGHLSDATTTAASRFRGPLSQASHGVDRTPDRRSPVRRGLGSGYSRCDVVCRDLSTFV